MDHPIAQTPIAQALWTARLDGRVIARDADGAPASTADSYAAQTAQIALANSKQIGWKLGATSTKSLELLGLAESFIGPLFEQFDYQSGGDVPIIPAHGPCIESEFSVVLGAALPARPEPYARADIDAAVAGVCPSFEIVGCRIAGGPAGAGHLLIADGGVNAASVFGTPVADWASFDLRDHPVRLSINGQEVAQGSNAALLWDHTLDAIVWLANHPALAGRGLPAGATIMTGTCTGMTPVSPGDEAVADFGTLGEVRVRFR